MDKKLHCVVKKRLQLKRKKGVTRSHISGNRGYNSNRVCFPLFVESDDPTNPFNNKPCTGVCGYAVIAALIYISFLILYVNKYMF